jgi:SAM-dependent methyltransferase
LGSYLRDECTLIEGRKNMDWPTFEQRKLYWAVLLMVFLGVLGEMVWVALPTAAGFFDLKPGRKSVRHALLALQRQQDRQFIAPFVPTPQDVLDRMLELAEVRNGDILYDLGSGDGRIVIIAAKRYGIKAVGFEIDPVLVKESRESIEKAGLGNLVEIREEDIRTVDFSRATVLTLYLYPGANLRLRSAIRRQLKPGSRVVSHAFGMGDWKPDHIEQFTDSTGLPRTIYLWRIAQKQ